MNTIFKTKLDICDHQVIHLPMNFNILHIAMQDGAPCIWYECDSEAEIVDLDIYCFGTGYNMDDLPPMKYIGTVRTMPGLVWHFYRALVVKS